MADLIQIRRDRGSVWQSVNPTLALAEIGIVLDDNGAMTNPIQFKVGNGSTAWNNLPMQNGSAINKIKVNGVELTIDGNRAVDVIVKASGSLGTDVSSSTVAFVDSTGVVRSSSINIANTSGSSTSSLITQAAVSESIADVRKDIDLLSGSVSGSFAAVDERVTGIEENIENNYAKIDGSYDSMAVGVAKNLEGDQEVEDTFISRTAGGTAEIANGVSQILEVKGNSVVWNQFSSLIGESLITSTSGGFFYKDHDLESYIPVGHKYLMCALAKADGTSTSAIEPLSYRQGASSGVVTIIDKSGNYSFVAHIDVAINTITGFRQFSYDGTFNGIKEVCLYDLTLMFGAGNEPSTVEEFEAWLADNIGALDHYPYNAGTVLNNAMEGIETTGFNLLDPATGKAQILGAYDDASGNFYGITGTHGTITFKAADGTEETVTPGADGKFQLTVPGELTVANAGADCAVFFWRDGSKTEYEEYDKNVSYLDVKNIYGKLNGSGSLVQVFPDGMAGVNNVKDVLRVENDKPVADRKVGVVDLGTLNYSYLSQEQTGFLFYSPLGLPAINDNSKSVCICEKYLAISATKLYSDRSADKVVTIEDGNKVKIRDSAYTDASTFKTAMSGVKFYYELATPQHYTDLVYINSSHFADNTPVALPVTYTVNNWGIENILPKNTSESVSTGPADLLCRYAIDAVAQLNAHSNQIEDLHEVKADKKGTYPGLVAGNLVDTSGVGTEQQFVFRHTGGEEHVADKTQAVIQKYMGKSLVWNQLVPMKASGTTETINGVTITYTDNGFRLQGTATNIVRFTALGTCNLKEGHKYLTFGGSSGTSLQVEQWGGNPIDSRRGQPAIVTISTTPTAPGTMNIYCFNEEIFDGKELHWQFCDLTQMFGAGNEPSTVAEFEAMFPLPYYAYNEGTIISNKADSIKTVGFNQWDEEWELGAITSSTGANTPSDKDIRSKNYIPVMPGTTYYCKCPQNSLNVRYYDANKNFLAAFNTTIVNAFTTPSGAHYLRFWGLGTTYNHDICINLSDPTKNGTYEPYEKHSTRIGLGEFQVKDSEGNVITVNGLKSAGSTYDEIDPVKKKYIKRIEVQVFDGTESWRMIGSVIGFNIGIPNALRYNVLVAGYTYRANSWELEDMEYSVNDYFIGFKNNKYADVESWKRHLAELYAAGTPLVVYYELATPEEYDLVGNLPEAYPVFGGGTEAILPDGVDEETGVPKTTPFRAVIFYSKDYLSQLNSMPRDYISVGSMTSFYTELASKLGAAISKSISVSASFNSSDQKYDYVITISDISGSI